MAVDLYEAYTNPITGETFKRVPADESIYKMEWTVQPQGYVALEHIHLYQDEIFYVKKGQLRVLIEGKENIVDAGGAITVPKGSRHIAFNNQQDVLECDIEYTPALDFSTFMQCFLGLQKDKDYDAKGQINIPKMCYFMYKTRCNALARPASIPAPVFGLVINLFGIIGSIAGWKQQLQDYTA